jgi:hypothetical protein
MVDDGSEIRKTIERAAHGIEMTGKGENIEGQTGVGDPRQRLHDSGTHDPGIVGKILEHWPHTDGFRMPRECGQRGCEMRILEIEKPLHARHEIRVPGQIE